MGAIEAGLAVRKDEADLADEADDTDVVRERGKVEPDGFGFELRNQSRGFSQLPSALMAIA